MSEVDWTKGIRKGSDYERSKNRERKKYKPYVQYLNFRIVAVNASSLIYICTKLYVVCTKT